MDASLPLPSSSPLVLWLAVTGWAQSDWASAHVWMDDTTQGVFGSGSGAIRERGVRSAVIDSCQVWHCQPDTVCSDCLLSLPLSSSQHHSLSPLAQGASASVQLECTPERPRRSTAVVSRSRTGVCFSASEWCFLSGCCWVEVWRGQSLESVKTQVKIVFGA